MSEEFVEENLFPAIVAALPNAVDKAIRETAFRIEGRAKLIAREKKIHVTGFLKSSIYTKTHNGEHNDYGQFTNPPADESKILPEVETPPLMTAIVAVAAAYGIYVEMGTRYKPARPYLIPAAEASKGDLEAEMAKLEAYLLEYL